MIRDAFEGDMPAILDIYNDAVLTSTAVYSYRPQSLEDRLAWFAQKKRDGLPVLVYEVVDGTSAEGAGRVAGFATYGQFRPWPGFKYTMEHSVYVHRDFRARRIGSALLGELVRIADARGVATMVAGIDAGNAGSRALHEQLGFTEAGVIRKAGYKFGQWLDLAFYQLQLRGPATPTEDDDED
ncbi:GCN5-related N-acetyltransferase [Desulfovibrio sp. X2]|uniref:GNAT family N-acetyltransferase n=1 Tax=Desulfovibrio sp. X2 TaxID=941449 RepID=UPI000358E437|nr:GNAT family N-acetyltransferase [Desulfovibrio sp. X2]EPR41097.1 GCN5-related N-acetyltransferase [Desulfovibrio sp. X2]